MSSTTYYIYGNGQVVSTNKVFGTFLTKLVTENKINCDEYMLIVLFSYIIAYKVSIIVWITSIDAHRVHSANYWWQSERQYFSEGFN